jgi:aspartyl/asparaginyl-tRNA synthetase
MEPSFPPFDAQLAKLIHTTRRSIRNLLDREGFVEITHPNLDPGSDVAYYDTFRVTIPEKKEFAAFTGTLLVSGSRYLIEATRHVSRCYRIGPSFRVDKDGSNRLLEFESIHISHEGTIGDAEAFVEQILQTVIEDASPISMAQKNNLRKISFPLRRITHAEATETLGLKRGTDLSLDQQSQLLSKMDVPALFLTNTPQSINPYAVFHRIVDDLEL